MNAAPPSPPPLPVDTVQGLEVVDGLAKFCDIAERKALADKGIAAPDDWPSPMGILLRELTAEIRRLRVVATELRAAAIPYVVHHGGSATRHDRISSEGCPEADEPEIGSPPCAECLMDDRLERALKQVIVKEAVE